MRNIGPLELILILVIILLIFGGGKIVDLAKSLGKAKAEFKKAQEEAETDDKAKATKVKESEKPSAAK